MSRVLMLLLAALALATALPALAQEPVPAAPPPLSADITFEQWQKLPEKVRYSPGGAIPPYYEQRRLAKKAMWITGISIFGGMYLGSTLVGVVEPPLYPLLIPVVGPFIAITTATQAYGPSPVGTWWLAMDGIAQTTGIILFFWGLNDKQDWLVKKPYGFAELHFVPNVGPHYAGGVLLGRF